MFVIEDTSGYGVLKALVAELEKDALDAKHAMTRYSERSRDYARAEGVRNHANSTIAFIMTTNVWKQGQYEEEQAKVTHWHLTTPEGIVYAADSSELLSDWCKENGVPVHDAFSMFAEGYNVKQCEDAACTSHGNWLARKVPTQSV
jgi:hypothetical protein